ncbi:MAG: hypothetical protein RLZZ179_479 [Verrucomicrobiota bacterium]|jgi:hypothetical protein
MRTRFWSVETAERLRHAADAGRTWSVWPLGTAIALLSVVFTLMVVYNGPALASRRASLEACAGMTSLLWLASSFVLAAALKQRLRELPDLPLALLMAPVEPEFLGRYAREFWIRGFVITILAALEAALGMVLVHGSVAARLGWPWRAGFTVPAALGLWLQIVLFAAVLPRLRLGFSRMARLVPLRIRGALAGLLTLGLILLVAAPLYWETAFGRSWIQPIGRELHRWLPGSALLSWPAEAPSLPWGSLLWLALLGGTAFPVIGRTIATLRAVPSVPAWDESLWNENPHGSAWDEWWDDETEEPVREAGESDGAGASLEPAWTTVMAAAALRERIAQHAGREQARSRPWVRDRLRLDHRSRIMVFAPVLLLLLAGHPFAELAAWIWLGVHLWEILPAAELHLCFTEHPVLLSAGRPSSHGWVPVSPEPAWRSWTRSSAAAVLRSVPAAFTAAGAMWLTAMSCRWLTTAWPWSGDFAAWKAPAAWGFAWATAVLPLLRPAWDWTTAPRSFGGIVVPADVLIPDWRLLRWLATLCAVLAGICGVAAVLLIALGPLAFSWGMPMARGLPVAWESSLAALGGWIGACFALRAVALLIFRHCWARGRRQ